MRRAKGLLFTPRKGQIETIEVLEHSTRVDLISQDR